MQIVNYPHPALRWKSKPIQAIDAALRKTVQQMFELMYEARGIGLAANQVALPLRVFIMNPTGDPEEKDQEFVFLNPEILSRSGNAEAEEGCLSLPQLYGDVRRPEKITVEAFDLGGECFRMDLSELPGRVVQHESDHLDGVMFIDRMSDAGRRQIESEIEEFEADFRRLQSIGEIPSDEELKAQLASLEPADA